MEQMESVKHRQQYQIQAFYLIATTLWAIWYHRYMTIFQEGRILPQQISQFALQNYLEFELLSGSPQYGEPIS